MLQVLAYLLAFGLLGAMFALLVLNVLMPSERAGYHRPAERYEESPIALDSQMVADTPDAAED